MYLNNIIKNNITINSNTRCRIQNTDMPKNKIVKFIKSPVPAWNGAFVIRKYLSLLNADLQVTEVYNTTNDVIAFRIIQRAGVKALKITGKPKIAMNANTVYTLISGLADQFKPTYPFTKIISIGTSGSAVLAITESGSIQITPLLNLTTNFGINLYEAYL